MGTDIIHIHPDADGAAIGQCSQEDIQAVCEWLKQQGMENLHHSELFDLWYGHLE